ncbi:isoprenyl transferase [Bryobacter aggregatus]|uniref:isoprenyl transferase n=1 Tax=Bryobacter aggregatus TaxID=360054 RepID=UPI0006898D1E|nr:isoprenyl transferase [Bryobacter aggregatus]
MTELFAALKPGSEEWLLATSLDPARLPRHIAVIMDGNGRWAKERRLPRIAGHKSGVDSVRNIVESAARLGIEALTLYAFSTENWKRPSLEVEALFRLLRLYLHSELATLMKNNVRLGAIGRISGLPSGVQKELQHVIDLTASNTGLRLNLALNYSGRTELVDAVKSIVASGIPPAQINEDTIERALYTSALPEPDLLIRTSGEMRISNFLLWQIAYTELVVSPTLWPDFRCRHLLEALLEFQRRERRFGGVEAAKEEAQVDLALR